jgi:hypothetical protein
VGAGGSEVGKDVVGLAVDDRVVEEDVGRVVEIRVVGVGVGEREPLGTGSTQLGLF